MLNRRVIGILICALSWSAALAQTPDPTKWTFDVVSIKEQDPNQQIIMGPTGTPENFQAEGVTVETLVAYAYDLTWSQGLSSSRDPRYLYQPHPPNLVLNSAWVSDERFDVTAKADPSVLEVWKKLTPAQQQTQLKQMVQAMLADRFQLKVHTEKLDMPVYALVVAKGGPKVTPSQPDLPPDPDHPKPYGSPMQLDLGLIAAHGLTMEQLAQLLWTRREIGSKKVIDRTGLMGKYDFKLKWTPEGDPDDAGGASIFTAIQEQLGLKLEPVKAPMDVVVIDHVEKPTAN